MFTPGYWKVAQRSSYLRLAGPAFELLLHCNTEHIQPNIHVRVSGAHQSLFLDFKNPGYISYYV